MKIGKIDIKKLVLGLAPLIAAVLPAVKQVVADSKTPKTPKATS